MIPSLIYLQNILNATVQFSISCCFAVSPFHFVFAQFQVTVKAVKKKIKVLLVSANGSNRLRVPLWIPPCIMESFNAGWQAEQSQRALLRRCTTDQHSVCIYFCPIVLVRPWVLSGGGRWGSSTFASQNSALVLWEALEQQSQMAVATAWRGCSSLPCQQTLTNSDGLCWKIVMLRDPSPSPFVFL